MSSQVNPEEDDDVETNPYMAKRAAKIARNEDRLRSLGLLSANQPTPQQVATAKRAQHSKRKPITPLEPVRRSQRLRKEGTSSQEGDSEVSTNDPQQQEHRNDVATLVTAANTTAAAVVTPQPRAPSIASPNSARAINLNLHRLLFGHGDAAGLLGRQLSHTGKAFAMQESARLAATFGCDNPHSISFNKYAGVQEWRNDVLFLWVNLNAPNSEVVNEFPGGGRQITWFGGSRMHDLSPVIQRLIRVGKREQKEGLDDACGIILWCRRYNAVKKTFTPYTCLGRLRYSSHQKGSHPLAFVWNLADFTNLAEHADPHVRNTFRGMVG